MPLRRVAVTGIGVVAPCGIGSKKFWTGICSPADNGEKRVTDFEPEKYFDNPKDVRRADRSTQFAIAAAEMAFENVGNLNTDPAKCGVFIGTGVGGIETLEEQIRILLEKGSKRVSPFLIPMMMPNAASAAVSMRYGFQGPAENSCTACAAGTHAIANAARLIESGRCDVMLAGGTEASFTGAATAGFTNMTAFSKTGISRTFDAERDGFVMGEGAAILLLEEWETATTRGAEPLAEILGSASTADAHHITAPSPGGQGAITCMELAIQEAGVSKTDIGYINAHGTSTPLNDLAEAEAVEKVFGSPGPPISSTKGVTGHALGAAGALEAVAVILSIKNKLLPPTAGYSTPDPGMPDLDYIKDTPRDWKPAPSLSNSFGFGGHNGCLVIGPP